MVDKAGAYNSIIHPETVNSQQSSQDVKKYQHDLLTIFVGNRIAHDKLDNAVYACYSRENTKAATKLVSMYYMSRPKQVLLDHIKKSNVELDIPKLSDDDDDGSQKNKQADPLIQYLLDDDSEKLLNVRMILPILLKLLFYVQK